MNGEAMLSVFIICMTLLAILCGGSPDLIDAFASNLGACPEPVAGD